MSTHAQTGIPVCSWVLIGVGGAVEAAPLGRLRRHAPYFDYVILDTAAGMGAPFTAAATVADKALLVLTPDPVALRDGKIVADRLLAGSRPRGAASTAPHTPMSTHAQTGIPVCSWVLIGVGGAVEAAPLGRLLVAMRPYFDYVILDTAAGMGAPFTAAATVADKALLVLTPDPVALRDGKIVADRLLAGSRPRGAASTAPHTPMSTHAQTGIPVCSWVLIGVGGAVEAAPGAVACRHAPLF